MRLRTVLWGGLGIFVLFLALGAGWLLSLPPTPEAIAAPAIGRQEADATIAALGPKRQRPLVAIIGINDATETTDYLMPYGILKRADVADVMTVEPDATVAAFDARHPQGADYVIVPAMSRDDDPAVLEWIRRQSAKGAIVIGICAGAKVVGASGLLDGKRATTHWYSVGGLRDRHPSIRYVADRRFVVDQGVATTTGITASMPMMLTLIEAIAGRQKAEAVATELGLTGWDARHASAAFKFTRPFALTAIRSTLAFWDHEQMGLELTPGMDEVSLALVADAWSRTYRSRAVTVSGTNEAITSRNGIRFLPDQVAASWPSERRIASFEHQPPVEALDQTLRNIADRYGTGTKDFVAMQLEYPKQGASQ